MMTVSSSMKPTAVAAASNTLKRKIDVNTDSAASDSCGDSSSTALILRKKLCLKKLNSLMDLKRSFVETISEHYYLKTNRSYLDYNLWKLNPGKEYQEFLNEQLVAKSDVALLEARINSSMSSLQALPPPVLSCATNTPTPSSATSSVTKFKYEYDQNAVHERAKHEANILQRISQLRHDGLWSIKRLPKLCEPKRPKVHWDYLLDEMLWMSNDFQQERKWKKAISKKIAGAIQKYFKDKEIKAEVVEKEELKRMRKLAANVSREIMNFWKNVEKVVEFKQKTRDDEKRKKELDMHLNFIVDQTEKYSSRLMKGLVVSAGDGEKKRNEEENSKQLQNVSNQTGESEYEDAEEEVKNKEKKEDDDDASYNDENESDEDVDIESDEDIENYDVDEEIRQLQMESEMPIEDMLKEMPEQFFDKRSDDVSDEGSALNGESQLVLFDESEAKMEAEEFAGGEEDEDDDYSEDSNETTDVEDTIEEEENYQKQETYDPEDELKLLEEDSKIPIDELKSNLEEMTAADMKVEETTATTTGVVEVTHEQQKQPPTGDQEDKELNNIAAQAQSLQPTGYTLETTNVKTKVPFLLKYPLREYQHVGLDWLVTMHENKLNGILADEMGLGKTIQTIALLAHLACDKGNWGPHLIVVPTSVMLNWELEFKKWCPAFKILTYYGTPKERRLKRQGWTKFNAFHVCITSYKLVIQDHGSFRRKKWKYFILDEAQNIKNFKSQRWQGLLNFQSQRRLLLTGTPLQNNLMELWSLMHFLMPNVFASHREFQQWFSNPLKYMIEGNQEYNEQLIKRLHKVLRPFILRRLKVDVEKQMPKKYEHIIRCKLSKRQRLLYDEFMSNTKTKATLNEGNYMSVINVLMQLRKVCNHPDLFDPRPIVSPFVCESINYETSSLVFNLSENLFDERADTLFSLQPNYVNMEQLYSAFTCHRAKRLQTTKKQIEDILLASVQSSLTPADELTENEKASFYFDKKLVISSYDLDRKKAIFEMKNLIDKRSSRVKQNIQFLTRTNRQRCQFKPIYGQDLHEYVQKLAEPLKITHAADYVQDYSWNSGFANCLQIIRTTEAARYKPHVYWTQTNALRDCIHTTADDYYTELKDIIQRFVIYIPPVRCFSTVKLHCSHPNVSLKRKEVLLVEELNLDVRQHLSQEAACDHLYKIQSLLNTQFPEKRLIQYDCGKLQSLDILLHRLFSGSHRVLIFTQMTRMLDILENFLNYHGYKYLRLDGATTIENRQLLMERFNNDKRIFCFILSTRSGGIGVNLTGADTVVFYDSDWNPTMDAQAQDRCHRIGQTRDVHIYRLISEKTIEENILKKANQKRLLSEVTIEGGCFTTAVLKKHNIKELFDQPTGLNENDLLDLNLMRQQRLLEQQQQQQSQRDETLNEVAAPIDECPVVPLNTISEIEFEEALATVEDETDVQAAKELKAEVKADDAEFDENVLWDDERMKSKHADSMDRVESELKSIENELRPIERYALKFLEAYGNMANALKEESNVDIEKAKRDWELQRLRALKEEEDRQAELEDEEMMFTYPKTEVNSSFNSKSNSSKKRSSSSKVVNSINTTAAAAQRSSLRTRRATVIGANETTTTTMTNSANSKTVTVSSIINSKNSLIENELAKYNKTFEGESPNSRQSSSARRGKKNVKSLDREISVSSVGRASRQQQQQQPTIKKGLKKGNDVEEAAANEDAANAAVADVIASLSASSNRVRSKIVETKRPRSLNSNEQQQKASVLPAAKPVVTATPMITQIAVSTAADIKRMPRRSMDTENIYRKPFNSYRTRGTAPPPPQPQQTTTTTTTRTTIVNNNTNNYIINNTTNNYTFITTIASNPNQSAKVMTSVVQPSVKTTPVGVTSTSLNNNHDDDDNDLLLTETPTIDISNLFNLKQFNPPPTITTVKPSSTSLTASALTSVPIVINKSVFTATTKTTQVTSTLSHDNNSANNTTTRQTGKPITTLIKRTLNNKTPPK